MAEIPETAITWTHDDGQIHIDTRSARLVGKLRRVGIEPIENNMRGGGYASFRANESQVQIIFTKPRTLKPISEEEREVRRERMRAMNTRTNTQNQPKEAP